MAWYTVKYSCGHEEGRQMYGSYRSRDEKLAWLKESGLCPECFKAMKQNEEARLAEQFNVGFGPLVGSEKQIAWAFQIRGKHMQEFQQRFKRVPEQDFSIGLQVMRELVNAKTDAKWWIDNRNMTLWAMRNEWGEAIRQAFPEQVPQATK